jgi:hypothetical protein
MGHAGTWHTMGWGGDVTWGGGVTCLRGSYANRVTGYGQAGVADVMDRVAVFFVPDHSFHLACLMFSHTETQHLMYKVRDNYSNCTCRSSENICSSSGGTQDKRKDWSKQDETQFGTRSGAFLSLTPTPSPPPLEG